jgi:hypothetical protein
MHACMLVYTCSFTVPYIFSVAGNIVFGRYCYTEDLLALEAAVPYEMNLPSECRHIVSPLKPAMCELLLSEHPDRQFVDYLIRGLHGGFRIGCRVTARDLQSVSVNMPSAILHPEVIDKSRVFHVHSARGHLVRQEIARSFPIQLNRLAGSCTSCGMDNKMRGM